MEEVLKIVKEELTDISVPYEYMMWTSSVNGAYFVGELSETPVDTEDGLKLYTLLLTGTTRGTWLELEQYRQKIEGHFPAVYGLRKSTANGAAVFYYSHSFPVPTGEAELKRIEIYIDIKEWRAIT